MKPFFETLSYVNGKLYTKPRYLSSLGPRGLLRPTLMHHASNLGSHNKCNNRCFQGFPLQTCGNACGLCPIFMAAFARKHENAWKYTLEQTDYELCKRIKHISTKSSLLRVVLMSWLVQDEVSLCYLDPTITLFPKWSNVEEPLVKDSPLSRSSTSNTNPTGKNRKDFTCAEKIDPFKRLPSDSGVLAQNVLTDNTIPGKHLSFDTSVLTESLPAQGRSPEKHLLTDAQIPDKKPPTHSKIPAQLSTSPGVPEESIPNHNNILEIACPPTPKLVKKTFPIIAKIVQRTCTLMLTFPKRACQLIAG